MNTCIGCGCDDENACLDTATGQGCSWLRVDRENCLGVCSCCADHVERFDKGDRNPTERAFAAVAQREDQHTAEPALLLPGDDEYHDTLREMRAR